MFSFKAINIALVLVYSIGSALWVSTGDTWYRSLNQPSWQPPNWVFGLIWPYNFLVLGILGWLVASRCNLVTNTWWSFLFGVGVVAALLWSRIFYVNHQLTIATIFLAVTALFAILLFLFSLRSVGVISVITLPYVIWVCTATYLSYSYAKLN